MSTKQPIWPSGRFGVPQITPFTYRDGHTHLELIEALRDYVVERLHPSLVSTVNSLVEQMEAEYGKALDQYVNGVEEFQRIHDAFMSDVNATLTALNDTAVSDLVDDPNTLLGDTLRELFPEHYQVHRIAVHAASFGAVENSVDSSQAIQAAIDYAHAHGIRTVIVEGEHNIVGHDTSGDPRGYLYGVGGIALYSDMTLDLTNATLTLVPNDNLSYNIIRVEDCENVEILGGRLIGDKYITTQISGWGNGIALTNTSNVTIRGTRIEKMRADGIYVFASSDVGGHINEHVTIQHVVCDDNKRQGISVIGGRHILIENSTFSNSRGADPESGIDIEPNERHTVCEHIIVRNCVIYGNGRYGFLITAGNIHNVTVDGCLVYGNGGNNNILNHGQISVFNDVTGLRITNTTVSEDLPDRPTSVVLHAQHTIFSGNTIARRLELRGDDSGANTNYTIAQNVLGDNFVFRGRVSVLFRENQIHTTTGTNGQIVPIGPKSVLQFIRNVFQPTTMKPINGVIARDTVYDFVSNTFHDMPQYGLTFRITGGGVNLSQNTFLTDETPVFMSNSENIHIEGNTIQDQKIVHFEGTITNGLVAHNTPNQAVTRKPNGSQNVWISEHPLTWWHDGVETSLNG